MELALTDSESQEKPNIRGTVTKHGLVESTLRRRWKGEIVSMAAASSEYKQRLSGPQEEAFIHLINSLTDRGLPPTSRIIRNLASKKLQREEEKLQKAAAAVERQRLAAEAKTAKAAESQARKELREEAKRHKKGKLELQKRSTGSYRIQKTPRKQARQPRSSVTAQEEEIALLATFRGRRVQLPRRFTMLFFVYIINFDTIVLLIYSILTSNSDVVVVE